MLKEMGNQNATAITEEAKAANETPSNSSNENTTEENETKDEQLIPSAVSQESADDFMPGSEGDGHEEDQTLDHIKQEDGNDESIGGNSVEPNSNEIQGSENSAFAIKDDDAEDQGIEDTTLNPTAGSASHESDDLATLDAKADYHVLEKSNEDMSIHVSEVSTGTSSSIDEISLQGTKEEIGHLMASKMSETVEEKDQKVIDEAEIPDQINSSSNLEVNKGDSSSNISHNQEVLLHSEGLPMASSEASSTEDETICLTREAEGVEASMEEEKMHQGIDEYANQTNCNDQELGGGHQIEVLKTVMDTSLHVERYDHVPNNPTSPQDSEDDETQKFYEFDGKLHEEKDPGSLDHVADFKDLEIIKCNPTHESSHLEVYDQDTNIPGTEFRPEIDHKDNSTNEAVPDENNSTRFIIEKSPSFEFMNLIITKTEESDQTPLLYNNKKAPMRSLSTPVTARFVTPLVGADQNGNSSAEERTINIVDYDQKLPIRSPLNGLSLKDQEEETHLLKPQKTQQEAENSESQKEICNGHVIIGLQGSRNRKRSKARMSGSYLFSSCICCARVEQLGE